MTFEHFFFLLFRCIIPMITGGAIAYIIIKREKDDGPKI